MAYEQRVTVSCLNPHGNDQHNLSCSKYELRVDNHIYYITPNNAGATWAAWAAVVRSHIKHYILTIDADGNPSGLSVDYSQF